MRASICRLGALALLLGLLASVQQGTAWATAQAANDATCTLAVTGTYVSPTGLTPAYVSGDGGSRASSPRYQVHASGSPGSTSLTVERLGDGETFGPYSSDSLSWGFSPDQDRFLTVSAVSGQATYRVYDLASAHPTTPLHQETLTAGSARLGWSPHGEFFAVSAMTSPTAVDLRVYDAVTNAAALQTSVSLLVTGGGEEDFQGAGWGFSPDDDEFVYAAVTGAQSTSLSVVDLDAGATRYGTALGGSAYWKFSPRGDLLAIVNQTGASSEDVWLVGTHANSDVRASATYGAIADDGFEATPEGHVYHLGTQSYVLAPLTAPTPDNCPPTWSADASLTSSDVTATRASLSWTGAEDDTAVTGYRVLRVGTSSTTQVAEVDAASTSYDLTGLDPETTYTFRVEARDAAGHWSTDGPSTQLTTLAPPPAWPANSELTASELTSTSVRLSWADLAAVPLPVTGYRLYQDGELVASLGVATRTRAVTGLAPCEDHLFTVQAVWSGTDGESVDGPATRVTTAGGGGFGCSRVYADKDVNGRYSGPAEVDNVNFAVSLAWTNVDADHNVLSSGAEVPRAGSGLVRYPVTGADTYISYGWPIFDWHNDALYPSFYEPSSGDFYRLSDDPASTDVRIWGGFGAGWSTSYQPIDGSGTIAGVVFDDMNANGARDPGEPGLADRQLFCSSQWVPATPSGRCEATTDADGAFRFAVNGAVIELGSSTDSTDGPAYLWGNGYDGWFRTTPAKAYAVRNGDAYTGADFGYVHGESTLHGNVFEDLDGNHVRGSGENGLRVPPPGLQVCVQHQTITNAVKCGGVDDTGDWQVANLPPGAYDVTLRLGPSGDLYTQTLPAGGGYTATVTANGDDVAVPDFGIHGTYALVTGTVFADANEDGVRDAGESPVEGHQICAGNGIGEGSIHVCVFSDVDGRYALGPFPAGDLTVTGSDGSTYTTPIGQSGPGTWTGSVVVGQEVSLDFGVGAPPVPGAPTGLTAAVGDGYVDLAWDPAEAPADHPVSGYHVLWYADDHDPIEPNGCDTDASTTSCRIQLADPHEPITVAVYAYNDAGDGERTTIRLFTDPPVTDPPVTGPPVTGPPVVEKPSAVRGLKVNAMTHHRLRIAWAQASRAATYVVQVRSGPRGRWRTVRVTTVRQVTVNGSGTTMWVRVGAVNPAGSGPWSKGARVRFTRRG